MLYSTADEPLHPGGADYRLSLSAAQREALGPDALTLLERIAVTLAGLAALRSPAGTWDGGTKEQHVADVVDWAVLLDALSSLKYMLGGLTNAAIREHAHAGGSYEHLAQAMQVVKGTAQKRRVAAIGTKEEPVAPGAAEVWARSRAGA